MAFFGTDVEERRADSDDVINFARMYQPFEPVSHDHHVEIRRRKRAGKLAARLVRQAKDV